MSSTLSQARSYLVHPAFPTPIPAEGNFEFDVECGDLPKEWTVLSDRDQVEALRKSWILVSAWAASRSDTLIASEYPSNQRALLEGLGLGPLDQVSSTRFGDSNTLVLNLNSTPDDITPSLRSLIDVPYLHLKILQDGICRVEVRDLSWDSVYVWGDETEVQELFDAMHR